ncbi:AlpA family transcriptional regulator [Aquisalimonas sp. 2447]|uniref:helix-turn-helix transcriptional regulator n=1 Tax=Aquisalimonas sp. 2447 TaxID=2740807 RepID=UPI0014324DEE|nr:AlpA family transcriptional regulator [Aquisalimonas sp. 2447]QIT56898.1 AlpA family transcriptional regulator [Aquisalimonas sp. 2447]
MPERVDHPATPDRIMRLPEVSHVTGKGRSSIYRDMDQGTFPIGIKLGPRARGWWASSIYEWLANRPTAASGE